MSTKDSKKRLRQAREATDGSVEVLCFACRRTADTTKQVGLAAFFTKPAATGGDELPPSTMLRCAKCRRQMDKHQLAVRGGSGGAPSSSGSRVLPQIARLRQYQRLSTEQGMAFAMQESVATALMRLPCIACGALAPTEGHGLTRLRVWPDGLARPARGGFMGPFHLSNVAPCCGTCNLMKGYRRVRGFIEAARHIATHRASAASGEDYGLYPRRFRNNVSKRSRSAYISASSTHTKTHAMSNETFNRITARPCRYCGKPSDPPRHYNGLDRLDSACRVYTAETCDRCVMAPRCMSSLEDCMCLHLTAVECNVRQLLRRLQHDEVHLHRGLFHRALRRRRQAQCRSDLVARRRGRRRRGDRRSRRAG